MLLLLLLLLATSKYSTSAATLFPNTSKSTTEARECLLKNFNVTGSNRERKVFSQYGEDGIIETIFECVGTFSKYYVEFGVQDGNECSTRNLRQNHNFTGLLMDGGWSRPEINLQKEMMYSHNIVQLFQKHQVPHPLFDHLTVDLDLNTFWIALAVLRGGYRPRSLAAEINRNFAWSQSYATVDMPSEMAFTHDACGGGCDGPPVIGDCYFGASVKAWVTMVRSFGYHLVAVGSEGVNVFFVHESVSGTEPLLTVEDAKRMFSGGAEYPMIHGPCMRMPWVRIDGSVDYSQTSLNVKDFPVVVMSHRPSGARNMVREFYPVDLPAGIHLQLADNQTQAGGQQPHGGAAPAAAEAKHVTVFARGQAAHAVPAKISETKLADAMVLVMVGTAFVCGVLTQRFWGLVMRAAGGSKLVKSNRQDRL